MSEFVVPSTSFWNFSIHLYDQPGVADACLQLQNDHGLDVNLVLFCIWYANVKGKMTPDLLQTAITYSQEWKREIVQPLRDVRTGMKANQQLAAEIGNNEYDKLRAQVKSLELQTEKLQQMRLQEIADAEKATGENFEVPQRENLILLCEQLSLDWDTNVEPLFQHIISRSEVAGSAK